MLRVLLLLWSLLAASLLSAQDIHLVTQSDGNEVRLRWAIDQPDDWQWANDHGYTITRMTRRVNGQLLSVGNQSLSRTVLVNNLRPKPVNHWPSVTAAHNDKLVAQRIYRAEHVKSAYEIVSSGNFGVVERTWQDAAPLPSGYYILELEDENGHLYRTQPQAAQLIDQTPPGVPTGLSGEDRGDGSVVISWNANPEADLKGYQLFRCYARGGQFATVEVDLLQDTSYTDDVRGTIVNDSIFYRLQAKDVRGNGSEHTPVLVVARVDITLTRPKIG